TWIRLERVKCFYGLDRTVEARKLAHELTQDKQFLQSGRMEELARECESAKDFGVAAEAWEASLRLMRARNRGHIDPGTAATFYKNAGEAYARSGNEAKALDSFLRGMS